MRKINFAFHKDEIYIEGRENRYLVVPSKKQFALYVQFGQGYEWILDGKFDALKEAIRHVNACLAFESDGLAWEFKGDILEFKSKELN